MPAACDRVASLGYGDALIEVGAWKRGKSKIAHHPAISQMVVEHERVATVLGRARCADQRGKE